MPFWIYLGLANLAAFALTGADKYWAIKKMRRLPEKSIIQIAAVGGGTGVLLAFYLFRHKTKHYKLLLTVWLITLAETAALIYFFCMR